MIKLKIDVKKIAKEHLFTGAKGTYLDLALIENKDGEDQYGNAGFIVQEVTKEQREAGVKGPIIGNFKHVGTGSGGGNRNPMGGVDRTANEARRQPAGTTRDNSAADGPDDSDDIPFNHHPAPFQP